MTTELSQAINLQLMLKFLLIRKHAELLSTQPKTQRSLAAMSTVVVFDLDETVDTHHVNWVFAPSEFSMDVAVKTHFSLKLQ